MDADGGQPAIAPEPEPSPLIHLPSELWGKILKKIGQKDALNLRLVNKYFMEKVNNLYEDWKIKLDEKSPFLEMILDLRVKEVKVYRLLNTPSFRPQGILFKYPDLIQKLTLDLCMWSTQNAHILLQSKNLKSIRLSLYGSTEPVLALPLIGYNYPDLHTLTISLVHREKEENQFLEPENLFQRMMMSSMMPKLKSFNFSHASHNNMDMIYNYSSVLISFLSRQGQNLQLFHFTSWLSQSHSITGFPPLDDSTVLKNMTGLKTLKLDPWGVDPLHKTWRCLIQNQKNLVNLDLSDRFVTSSTFLKEIVAQNFQTLTSVEINWTFEEGQADGVFDASIFQTCCSLTNFEVIHDPSNVNVVNLFSLPTQIQTVDLSDFGADSGDLLNFLEAHPVLSSLSIRSGGNLPVLEAVLSHGSLLYAGIDCGIEVPASPSGLARLNGIFDAFKCRKFRGQFIFKNPFLIKRLTVTANWESQNEG